MEENCVLMRESTAGVVDRSIMGADSAHGRSTPPSGEQGHESRVIRSGARQHRQ
jgi:hypothetical protein